MRYVAQRSQAFRFHFMQGQGQALYLRSGRKLVHSRSVEVVTLWGREVRVLTCSMGAEG
jgi:hypothetical protein